MTTKTMDGDEYLANLEISDEQNYNRLLGEEYIKKSDVEKLIIAYKSHEINHINILQKAISSLHTINLSVIDEMIEGTKYVFTNANGNIVRRKANLINGKNLKSRLSLTQK